MVPGVRVDFKIINCSGFENSSILSTTISKLVRSYFPSLLIGVPTVMITTSNSDKSAKFDVKRSDPSFILF